MNLARQMIPIEMSSVEISPPRDIAEHIVLDFLPINALMFMRSDSASDVTKNTSIDEQCYRLIEFYLCGI